MNIEELREKRYQYYCASVSLTNAAIELGNSLLYLKISQETLEQSYQIDNQPLDDGKMRELRNRIEHTIEIINNNAIPNLENRIRELDMEIELQGI